MRGKAHCKVRLSTKLSEEGREWPKLLSVELMITGEGRADNRRAGSYRGLGTNVESGGWQQKQQYGE